MPDPAKAQEPLSTALLLATSGGMLDAFTYLNHGHVFANAMTGNVVLLGVSLLHHSLSDAFEHLVPLCAFLAGVATSRSLRQRLDRHAATVGLVFEIIALFLIGWLPDSLPQALFTASIAFAAANQVASFRHVHSFSYNSTFVTGNLRDMVEGFHDSIARDTAPEDRSKALGKTRDLGSVCLCFLVGAVLGATLAPRFGNHTLWFVLPLLVLAGITFQNRGRETT